MPSPAQRRAALIGWLAMAWVAAAAAQGPIGAAEQSDWSDGPGAAGGSVTEWGARFEGSDGLSWMAIPGQLSLSGDPSSSAVESTVDEHFPGPAGLDVVDVDADGRPDLLGAAIHGDRVAWWRNLGGNPPLWAPRIIDQNVPGAASVRGGDLDGDGDVDVVACAWDGSEVTWWQNQGGGIEWVRRSIDREFGSAHWVDVADVDGDGRLDVIGAAAEPGWIAWWRNQGGDPMQWLRTLVDVEFGGARSAVPADIDSDGRTDIVGAALADGQVSWWRNDDGVGTAWTRFEVAGLSLAHHALPVDLDRDGDMDIVAAGYGSSRIALWSNEGGEPIHWRRTIVGNQFTGALVVQAADLDGDNDLDVAATSDLMDRVSWWRNDGTEPIQWPDTVLSGELSGPWPLAVGDLDGNGSLDVVSGAGGGSDVRLWQVADLVGSGSLTSSILETPTAIVDPWCEIDALVSQGTSLTVELRVGRRADAMGQWQVIEPGAAAPVFVSGPALLQYRLTLATTRSHLSPVVRHVRCQWSSQLPSVPPRRPEGRRQP